MSPTVLLKKGNWAVETLSPRKGELEMAGQRFEECVSCTMSPCHPKYVFNPKFSRERVAGDPFTRHKL